ncbi:MAG: iron-only hydrogenase system regulator [Clostridia bacterium]|nr:iron-only hydrogenase system regulator [Clostridia bacterium]
MDGKSEETRVAVIAIVLENSEFADKVNDLLHDYSQYIIGRMGIPYRERGINVISVAIDAPQDVISALGGKIGRLTGISSKTVYSNA